jgi:hypothetical protein
LGTRTGLDGAAELLQADGAAELAAHRRGQVGGVAGALAHDERAGDAAPGDLEGAGVGARDGQDLLLAGGDDGVAQVACRSRGAPA